MLKNFLVSKVSVLALTAIMLNSLTAPAWSMDLEDKKDQNSNSAITVKNSNSNDESNNGGMNNHSPTKNNEIRYFTQLPNEVTTIILTKAAVHVGEDRRDLSTLACVCQLWEQIVNNENKITKDTIKKSWLRGRYDITDPQDIEIFNQFYKGVLIYRPNPNSDEGMIRLLISDLKNPLEGRFDLSQCANAGEYLSINTGYRKSQNPANAKKVEIWFTPRFLVNHEMPQMALNHHIKMIIGSWDAASAPVGIFWTWGGWDAADQYGYFDYLTTESMDELGSKNLFKKHRYGSLAVATWEWREVGDTEQRRPPRGGEKFHISFVN